jgi:hypothetical protein
MSLLSNLTGYGAVTLPAMRKDGLDLIVAITAARFQLPSPADPPEQPLELAGEQSDPPLGDVYCGPAECSGLRLEGQATYYRPATDIIVAGHARALHDQPTTQLQVAVRVGNCMQQAIVTGDRVWETGVSGLATAASAPTPFIAMPLVWERAFGGSIRDESGKLLQREHRNPVGRGYYRDDWEALGRFLPNIEDPRSAVRHPRDRPDPVGFGPVARWWHPRAVFAGTYDESWVRERAPIWPSDFDERFFCAAPASLQVAPHLSGGEWVQLKGLHREGTVNFRLPAPRLVARFQFNGHDVRRAMTMDAVIIESDTAQVTLIHRAAVPAAPAITAHRETIVRHIERWEDAIA